MASDGVVAPAVAGLADDQATKLAAEISSLEIALDQQEPTSPPHRSHDPQFNQKRSDPFQFGSRFLQEDDDPFEFNAWDHVETDDTYKEYAEQQYEMQRQAPVSNFDKCKWSRLFLLCFTSASTPPLRGAGCRLMMIYISYKHSSSELP